MPNINDNIRYRCRWSKRYQRWAQHKPPRTSFHPRLIKVCQNVLKNPLVLSHSSTMRPSNHRLFLLYRLMYLSPRHLLLIWTKPRLLNPLTTPRIQALNIPLHRHLISMSISTSTLQLPRLASLPPPCSHILQSLAVPSPRLRLLHRKQTPLHSRQMM